MVHRGSGTGQRVGADYIETGRLDTLIEDDHLLSPLDKCGHLAQVTFTIRPETQVCDIHLLGLQCREPIAIGKDHRCETGSLGRRAHGFRQPERPRIGEHSEREQHNPGPAGAHGSRRPIRAITQPFRGLVDALGGRLRDTDVGSSGQHERHRCS